MVDSYDLGPVPALRGTAVASLAELESHPELYFEGADILMMLMSSALVFLMIPGISLVYSGAADRYSAITMARIPLITTAFVGIQWYLWLYTLAFSPPTSSNHDGTFSWLGGDTTTNAFRNLSARPVGIGGGPKIPELVYALYQGMFACFTASIVAGSVMRKVPIGRFLVFISIWSIVVYSPIARWTWHAEGWSRKRGAMDFAGGTAVHICSGATVAAHSTFFQFEVRGWKLRNLVDQWWRRAREDRIQNPVLAGQMRTLRTGTNGPNQPVDAEAAAPLVQDRERILDLEIDHLDESENHSVTNIVLGTTLLWFGWFGFNGGSAQGANLRAVSAVLATHVAACAGGCVGLLLEWLMVLPSRFLRMDTSRVAPSVLGFCDGAISGLVAITPAAGFVPVNVAPVFGVVAAVICKFLRYYIRKRVLPYDILDICAVHAGGGFIGMLLTAFFADDVVTGLDGYSKLISKTTGRRVRNQLLDVSAGFLYSFSATFAILLLSKLVLQPGRHVWMGVKRAIHERLLLADEEYRRRYRLHVANREDGHELAQIALNTNDQNHINGSHNHGEADQIHVTSNQGDHGQTPGVSNQDGNPHTETARNPDGHSRHRPEVIRDKLMALPQHIASDRERGDLFEEV